MNPKARIAVTGCVVEKDADIISKIDGVTDIIKNCDKEKLLSLITGQASVTSNNITNFKGHTKAFVKVQDGCNNFCSFCKVPLVRGRSKSRPIDEIKKEVALLLDAGFKEIVLSGICLGEWGRDFKKTLELTDLIEGIDNLSKDFRIRLSSIELRYITQRLIKKIATSNKLCKHLHIPLQSGDDSILKKMNRPYTRDEFLKKIKEIRTSIPHIGITTDALVGFPGEEEVHFNATLALLKECKVHRIHAFSYSQREGTKAAALKRTVPDSIVRDRVDTLIRLSSELSYEYRKEFLDKEVEVLVESKRDKKTQLLTGYTDTYIRVLLEGDDSLMGSLYRCNISDVTLDSTLAKA